MIDTRKSKMARHTINVISQLGSRFLSFDFLSFTLL